MKSHKSELFYTALKARHEPLPDLLLNRKHFLKVPADWHVVITDIIGSTNAVMGGRHEDVNLIATGSIVTVLNLSFSNGIAVPFFFGGDGATFIVPDTLIDKVMQSLRAYRTQTLQGFGLELRTGTVAVAEIYEEGHEIWLSKFKRSDSFSIPVVLGGGLEHAEKLIKGEKGRQEESPEQEIDLSGMQCRWDKIPPPDNKDEIVTLLVVARKTSDQPEIFSRILHRMDQLYGSSEVRQPISVSKLKLRTTFTKLGAEIRLRLRRVNWFELLKTWLVTLYGYVYFQTKKGRDYLHNLVEMSDTLVLDGKINTVISGSEKQRTALQDLLDEMEQEGSIFYGLHISNASVMSCYVRNQKDDHIHFVDGSDGGYTKAAKILKAKIAAALNE